MYVYYTYIIFLLKIAYMYKTIVYFKKSYLIEI